MCPWHDGSRRRGGTLSCHLDVPRSLFDEHRHRTRIVPKGGAIGRVNIDDDVMWLACFGEKIVGEEKGSRGGNVVGVGNLIVAE